MGLLGSFAVWVGVLVTKPMGRNLGVVWMVAGLIFYLWYRRQQRLPPTARLQIEKLRIPGYQPVSIKKVLVPISRSEDLDSVQLAAQLAKDYAAQVTALYVIEIPSSLPLDTFFPEKLTFADSVLEQAQAVGREFEVPVKAQVKQARFAGQTIVEHAREEGDDLILLAARARPVSAGRGTFGSTVEYVVRNAPCRVSIHTGKGIGWVR
jgi:nucleotide-binding universal stress UspA family protein